jgi:hypothetical protein
MASKGWSQRSAMLSQDFLTWLENPHIPMQKMIEECMGNDKLLPWLIGIPIGLILSGIIIALDLEKYIIGLLCLPFLPVLLRTRRRREPPFRGRQGNGY